MAHQASPGRKVPWATVAPGVNVPSAAPARDLFLAPRTLTVDSGFSGWLRYIGMDQSPNWEGSHRARSADNKDKDLKTSFLFVGGEYMINRSWTVMAELPLYDRSFTSTDDGAISGPAGE